MTVLTPDPGPDLVPELPLAALGDDRYLGVARGTVENRTGEQMEAEESRGECKACKRRN